MITARCFLFWIYNNKNAQANVDKNSKRSNLSALVPPTASLVLTGVAGVAAVAGVAGVAAVAGEAACGYADSATVKSSNAKPNM